VYAPGERLTRAVGSRGGAGDPQVPAEHLAPWAEVPTGAFALRTFAGGHFYFQTEESFFGELAAMLRD
ncbi:MAG: thioesterase, partial [Acidobacteriota bacterium]